MQRNRGKKGRTENTRERMEKERRMKAISGRLERRRERKKKREREKRRERPNWDMAEGKNARKKAKRIMFENITRKELGIERQNNGIRTRANYIGLVQL